MHWKSSLAVVSALLLIGAVGAAQAGDMDKKSSAMKKIDQNGDGVISLEEAKNAGVAGLPESFDDYDLNNNGSLEEGEFARFEEEHGGELKYESQTKEREMMENE